MCLLLSRPEGFSSQTVSLPCSSLKPQGSELVDALIAPFSFITSTVEEIHLVVGLAGARTEEAWEKGVFALKSGPREGPKFPEGLYISPAPMKEGSGGGLRAV